jgi:anti-sigma regulatory factor (Ser/Thr protein kinase)
MDAAHFMPHGMCFLWQANLLAFHVIADALIALAYFSIPVFLIWLVRRRGDLPFTWIFWLFALFIMSCGTTHLMAIWVIWHPDYWLEGAVKWVTAIASIGTAVMLIPLAPKLLHIRSPQQTERLLAQLNREHSIASSFQSASLSHLPEDPPGFQIDTIYRPAEGDLEIGGDWYDALTLLDGRLLVSIGDVAGKGLEASVLMSKVRQAIRVACQVQVEPAAILNAADRALRTEYPDAIVTAFVGIFDRVERAFTYASAGHPGPLVRAPDGGIEVLDGSSLPLGLRLREESAISYSRKLIEGSLFVLYTDGLTEATRDIATSETRLHDVVRSADTLVAPNPAARIHELVVGDAARDDVAVLTIRVTDLETEIDGRSWSFDVRSWADAKSAREGVCAFLRQNGARPDQVADAELIYAELLGNVVRYAPGPVEIRIHWNHGNPVLHVIDEGPGYSFAPRLPRDPYAESGRGLYLVASLAEDFHVSRRLGSGSHARAVLFPLATPSSPQSAAQLIAD